MPSTMTKLSPPSEKTTPATAWTPWGQAPMPKAHAAANDAGAPFEVAAANDDLPGLVRRGFTDFLRRHYFALAPTSRETGLGRFMSRCFRL